MSGGYDLLGGLHWNARNKAVFQEWTRYYKEVLASDITFYKPLSKLLCVTRLTWKNLKRIGLPPPLCGSLKMDLTFHKGGNVSFQAVIRNADDSFLAAIIHQMRGA